MSPVVSQYGHCECTTTFGTLKKYILVNYSNCFLRIIMYCMYSKEDNSKIESLAFW